MVSGNGNLISYYYIIIIVNTHPPNTFPFAVGETGPGCLIPTIKNKLGLRLPRKSHVTTCSDNELQRFHGPATPAAKTVNPNKYPITLKVGILSVTNPNPECVPPPESTMPERDPRESAQQPLALSANPNHPAKGSSIKVEPIRSKKAIARIKAHLGPRDRCLFTLGINTAYRANELLSIRVEQVRGLGAGDTLELKQSKTRKHRMVTLNAAAAAALAAFFDEDEELQRRLDRGKATYLFYSMKGERLTVSTVSTLVKQWCREAGLRGNYGSHTLRKTWGYWQYQAGRPIPLLMAAFGHATQRQTLAYLGIQEHEVRALYELEL